MCMTIFSHTYTHTYHRISSEKNKKVVDRIIHEIGSTEHTERQIRSNSAQLFSLYILISFCGYILDGCRTYRRSLRGKRKGRSDAEANRVRIRARQQRVSVFVCV